MNVHCYIYAIVAAAQFVVLAATAYASIDSADERVAWPHGSLPVVLKALEPSFPTEYAIKPATSPYTEAGHGYQASAPAQRLRYEFSVDGVRASETADATAFLRMRLARYANHDLPVPHIESKGAQIVLHYGKNLRLRNINSPFGLEQIVYIDTPPRSGDDSVIRLGMDVDLPHGWRLALGEQGIQFLDDHGTTRFSYASLAAWDANGKALAARFAIANQRVDLVVDARDAAYPVTVDPLLSNESKHVSTTPAAGANFGYEVDMAGDVMVVGAPLESTSDGAIYIFENINGVWNFTKRFAAPDGAASQGRFGWDVAVDDGTVLASAPFVDTGSILNHGAAYVFRYGAYCLTVLGAPLNCWAQRAHLLGSATNQTADMFGYSLDVSGSYVAVGALGDEVVDKILPDDTGSVYIFERDVLDSTYSSWNEVAQLQPADALTGDRFAWSLALDNTVLAVGAPEHSLGLGDEGAIYIYRRAGGWSNTPEKKLTPTSSMGAKFGYSVALRSQANGSNLLGGAPFDGEGAVYAYKAYYDGQTAKHVWQSDGKINPPNNDAAQLFGVSVSMDEKLAVIGAPLFKGQGIAYLYTHAGTGWMLGAQNTSNDLVAGDDYGGALAISQGRVAVGARGHDQAATDAGAVYTYNAPANTVLRRSYINQTSLRTVDTLSVHYRFRVGGIPAAGEGQSVKLSVLNSAGTEVLPPADRLQFVTSGTARFQSLSFDTPDTYTLQASYAGNGEWMPSKSQIDIITVLPHAGYALVVEGAYPGTPPPGEDSHNKSTQRIYQTLKMRGFSDDNIFYLNQDPTRDANDDGTADDQQVDGIDDVATLASIEKILTDTTDPNFQSLLEKANADPAPIYLFFVDHGARDRFYVNPGDSTVYMSPATLTGYLDSLQSQLNTAAAGYPLTTVIGACYSGSFIAPLSAPGRIVITSATDNEESYKGPPSPSDGIRGGEFFVDELIAELRHGENFRESFIRAKNRTLAYTRIDDTALLATNQYGDNAAQHPWIDDNSDAVGSTNLRGHNPNAVPRADGGLAISHYLGYGTFAEFGRLSGVTPTLLLPGPQVFEVSLSMDSDRGGCLGLAGVAIRTPGMQLAPPAANTEQQVINHDALSLSASGCARSANYNFSQAGKYELFHFVEEDGNFSEAVRSVAYVNAPGNSPPSAAGLLKPASNSQGKTQMWFDWSVARDNVDGDGVSYVHIISTDPTDANTDGVLDNISIQSEELLYSQYYASGLQDLTEYYWQVLAIDGRGGVTPSAVWSFITNDTNYGPGSVYGNAIRQGSIAGLDGVTLTFIPGGAPAQSDIDGSYNIEGLVEDTDGSVAGSKDGYRSTSTPAYVQYAAPSGPYDLQMVVDCSAISITPISNSVASGNSGPHAISVTANSGCAWTASADAGWIAIDSGDSGAGNGKVTYSVTQNLDTTSRNATITVTGNSHGVSQAGRPAVPGSLQFTSGNSNANESGSKTYNISRSGGSDGAISVICSSANGSATAGSDYTAVNQVLSWGDGVTTTRSCSVPITSDTIDESNETFSLRLSGITGGASLGTPNSVTITILDDDVTAVAGTLNFGGATYAVNESSAVLRATVNRSGGTSGAISVSCAATNGSAQAGSDFSVSTPVLNWASGDGGSKSCDITIGNDFTYEANETFTLSLANPGGGALLGTPSSVGVTIINDDSRYDLNDDGRVDSQDLAVIMSHWGGDNANADVTADGVVNKADMQALLAAM